ncbi:hypothetical protein K445DRAFT_315301 [Daldinia sp. EC12]|nr:hypothetical protein K445DRAFT_315301 [Daldinia sp. EC12]
MAAGDLIDFDIIEGQKENIQSLPGGRSAKKLVEAFSPSPLQPLHKLSTPTPTDTKNINDCIRAEYEAEVANISESDDPLDVFDRYVRWTFDAYPTAQATPQSQLHTLLERATKTFIGSAQYKNDPRYLKLWLHYIRFFSDSPRETYVFLSRHSIGEGLALFYEEYAAWLESAGRWAQAEEVYKLGIEREARPVQRLVRKFGEFEQRRAQQPDAENTPSSPAIPTVRPALVAKIDPFAAPARPADPQAPRPNMGVGGQSSKPAKAKLAVFSDAGAEPSAMSKMGEGSKGWDTIGSLADRKKENSVEAKPWAGETLTTQVKKSNGPKMAIFRDPSLSRIAESHIVIAPSKHQIIVNPQSGKRERVFVNLEAIYPTPEEPGTELSFEELWAANQGWLDVSWEEDSFAEEQQEPDLGQGTELDMLSNQVAEKLVVHQDIVELDENGAIKENPRPTKSKKKKVMEYNETQIIKAKLDSPSGPKIKKKKNGANSEPTMTMHTKAATDDIYDIFNAPLKPAQQEDTEESEEEEYTTDDDYTSGGESVNTTRRISTSEVGDDDDIADDKSVSEWSEFTVQKHVPKLDGGSDNEEEDEGEQSDSEVSDLIDTGNHQEDDNVTPEDSPPRTRFIPIPPEDYEAPTRPYRDPAEMANNRLPFMTPITERTESSLGVITGAKPRYTGTKTPNGYIDPTEEDEDEEGDDEDFEPPSSPLQEVLSGHRSPPKLAQPLLKKLKTAATSTPPSLGKLKEVQKGSIIKEPMCNPVDAAIREEILTRMRPSLSSYSGFYDHRAERCEKGAEIRKFVKAVAKSGGKKDSEKTSTIHAPVVLEFPEIMTEYTIKKELGAGAFAPVYLVENSSPESDENDENAPVAMGRGAFATTRRAPLEALKMEHPPTAWEFHMMRLAATRLGPHHRATASISAAHEMHLYQDEGFLFLPFHQHGTLLDVVNFFSETSKSPMDEALAMFFSIELLRTVEGLHSKQIMHGDLKPDNCLLRLDSAAPPSGPWRADGSAGWDTRGVVLIDFGRGIDMRAFEADVQFVADWRADQHDCAEVREGRPWTWQLDYHGLAGTIHTLLFGKYIETTRADSGERGLCTAAARRYKVREPLKRYWQTDIWHECFDLLLNPGAHVEAEDGCRMPVTRGLRRVRERMEKWLEANGEKGVGLRGLMARVEAMARSRRH